MISIILIILNFKFYFTVKLDNIENIIKTLITNQATNDLKKLFDEGALISRMCCKVKKKFRGEKLFRRLKQVIFSYLRKLCIHHPHLYYKICVCNLFLHFLDYCFDKKIVSTKHPGGYFEFIVNI